jgi:Tol biopolymer transport system component
VRPAFATRPFQTSTDWSGDGSRLLFTRWSSERSRGGIGVVGLDGSSPHVVIPGEDQPAAWSPDGRWIAFFDGTGISIATADGERRRLVFPTPANA